MSTNKETEEFREPARHVYVHGIFHSPQFDKFILLLMVSWILASGLWLYVEKEYILAGASLLDEGVYNLLLRYLVYFIVVFGILHIVAAFGRRIRFEFNREGFIYQGPLRSFAAPWSNVHHINITGRQGEIVLDDNKRVKLNPSLVRANASPRPRKFSGPLVARSFSATGLRFELEKMLGQEKIGRSRHESGR